MNEELVPVFLMNGEKISDVAYIPFTEITEGAWAVSGSAKLHLTSDIDRAIFETPIGCFEMALAMKAHADLTFAPGGDGSSPLTPCRRPGALAQQIEQASASH